MTLKFANQSVETAHSQYHIRIKLVMTCKDLLDREWCRIKSKDYNLELKIESDLLSDLKSFFYKFRCINKNY